MSYKEQRARIAARPINHVVVLGANGTMGYGSGALFTRAVPKVSFLARSREKAETGLAAAIRQVRSATVADSVVVGDYDQLDDELRTADIIFEAVAEDPAIKGQMYERVDGARRSDSIVATVSSGLSINELAADRSESFKRNFCGLHFFNPPNVIVGTELIAGDETDHEVLDFLEAFAHIKLGREVVRTADTPGFAGNRVGFKVLNEAAQLAAQLDPATVDAVFGPYTGRSLTPLRTIDLVGWDVHRAIVENITQKVDDEAIATLALPEYMRRLIDAGVLGRKSGGGFFKRTESERLVLDTQTGDYRPLSKVASIDLGYIAPITKCYAEGRYVEGMRLLLDAPGEAAAHARRFIAGYISYAFHRVGEVCASIDDIDRIMATGFNWAPPSLLVDTMGVEHAVRIIEDANLPVPLSLENPPTGGFFNSADLNPGRYFVAA